MEHELYTVKWLNENYSAHFEELYKSIYKRLYFFARNFLMDEALADDIVQEVFLGLWNKGKEMREDIPLERYLFISTRNLCVDYHRRLNILDKYQKHLMEAEAMVYFPYGGEETERAVKVRELLENRFSKTNQDIILKLCNYYSKTGVEIEYLGGVEI